MAMATEAAKDWLDYIRDQGSEVFFDYDPGQHLARKSVWVIAGLCAATVGLSGLLPMVLLSPEASETKDKNEGKASPASVSSSTEEDKNENKKSPLLKFMLSFAVGSLLGDVFLHLLPEAFIKIVESGGTKDEILQAHLNLGTWVVVGLLVFVFVEMLFSISDNKSEEVEGIKISGYLNLLANCVDNFSHGLAVGGAFLVSVKVGLVTTICILLHEVPHEIGDFAILLNSGFTRYEAAKAQFSTAFIGILGAFFALALDSFVAVEHFTWWIIPFTCGGFLNIALVTVLPDLLESKSLSEAFRTLSGISLGLTVMMSVSCL